MAAWGATAVAVRRKEGLSAAAPFGVHHWAFGIQALPSDGDTREFDRRRVVEIKHGPVSMLACTEATGLAEKSTAWQDCDVRRVSVLLLVATVTDEAPTALCARGRRRHPHRVAHNEEFVYPDHP